jgi:hypothetical protein
MSLEKDLEDAEANQGANSEQSIKAFNTIVNDGM